MTLKAKSSFQALLGATTLAVFAMTGPGCGGKGGGGGFGPDYTTGGGCPKNSFFKLPATCCDSSGNLVKATDECSATSASNPPTLGALTAAAAAGEVAGKANKDAAKLNSNGPNLSTGGIAAASAGSDKSNELGPKTIEAKAPQKKFQEGAPSSPAKTGSSGGSNPFGSGFLNAFGLGGSPNTIVKGAGEPGMQVAMTDPSVNAAAYSAGGGAGGRAGRGGDAGGAGGGFGAAGGLNAGDVGAEARIDYGSRDTASGDAMKGEDPADYFTRLNLSDNLFKVVERCYRKKAMTWATSDLDLVRKKQALDPAPVK